MPTKSQKSNQENFPSLKLGKPEEVKADLDPRLQRVILDVRAGKPLDALLEQPGRAITISAGNAWAKSSHASGQITVETPRTLTWQISAEDFTDNELEIWYGGADELAVSLITPAGQRLGPVAPGNTVPLISNQGETVGKIIHRQHDPNNHDHQIDILLHPSLPAGDWGVELTTKSKVPVSFHAFIERDDNGQSKFAPGDDDRSCTLGSISCGEKTIVVGSYLSGSPDLELSPFSAEGPSRDGKYKPEVSAPGQFLHPYWSQGILAARSSTQGTTRMSGTSMASPHVAGLIALLMQAAGRPLSIAEIRDAVMSHARKNPPSTETEWHPRFGAGRVNATSTILAQIPQPLSPLAVPAPVPVSDPQPLMAPNGVSIETLLLRLADAAAASRTRVSLEIAIEPLGTA